MTQVNLQHLSKQYGETQVVHQLHLTIPAGQITALLGPSGCGKTTLLKMIAGLLQPTAGDILFDHGSVLSIPAERRGAVMVFQNHLLFPYMSVGENVAFGLKMRGVDRATIQRKVAEMLALVRLPGLESRRPHQLSGGQQQRVALARALIVSPKVLLLDEPLSNLDAHLRDEMRELILTIQRQLGLTAVVVTHDREEAIVLANHIALLFEGRLEQFGPPRTFYEQPLTMRAARFFGGVNFLAGTKQGARVTTVLGTFQVASSPLPDGPVMLTIRPEQITLGDPGGHNSFPAHPIRQIYLGTHTRIRWEGVQATLIEMIADTASAARLVEGEPTWLHFPPDSLWLVPPPTP